MTAAKLGRPRKDPARDDRILALRGSASVRTIAAALHTTPGTVAGVFYRVDHPERGRTVLPKRPRSLTVGITMPPELRAQLEAHAQRTGRSISALLRDAAIRTLPRDSAGGAAR